MANQCGCLGSGLLAQLRIGGTHDSEDLAAVGAAK